MWSDLLAHAGQHLGLAGSALGIALAFGLPLGSVAAYGRRARAPILAAVGIGRTLPSLAVLTLLLPLLGVGARPAIVALALLAIPPVIINVDLAIRSVPRATIDAAAGLGMSARQQFARVVVPQALPIALSGVRTAATEVIASATLATFIGGGGLGDDIVRGLQTGNASLLFAGTVAVATLAIVTETVFARIAVRLERAA